MSFDDRDGYIWMDGEFVDWREAKVHVLTHTLHYGMGVFEGVRAYATDKGPAIFSFESPYREAFYSRLKSWAWDIPYSEQVINKAQIEAVSKNGLESGYLRPMAFYGSEAMGLHAHGFESTSDGCCVALGSLFG